MSPAGIDPVAGDDVDRSPVVDQGAKAPEAGQDELKGAEGQFSTLGHHHAGNRPKGEKHRWQEDDPVGTGLEKQVLILAKWDPTLGHDSSNQ